VVAAAKSLRLLDHIPIPDGGSLVFPLETDQGFRFQLQALPRNDWPHGSVKCQNFLINNAQGRLDFSLEKGSALEARLLALLDQCTFGKLKDEDPPTNEKTRKWITDRLRNRTLKHAPCPP
jgi:hypothetical protein